LSGRKKQIEFDFIDKMRIKYKIDRNAIHFNCSRQLKQMFARCFCKTYWKSCLSLFCYIYL